MLGGLAIIPSAPLLVPELAGSAPEAAELRAAALAAAESLPARWVAVGAGADGVFGPDAAGSFAGFGADVPVRLSPAADRPTDLPLCALVAGWVRGRLRPEAAIVVHAYTEPAAALAAGRRLRAEIEQSPEPIGVLVLADGATTLTPAAPGGHHPADVDLQRALDDALAGGDVAALAALPPQIVGRAAFAALAGLAATPPRAVTQLYRDAPYGVGYFVGSWQP
ncbi:hypothetical protein EHH44_04045 [Mycolicibacter terrae]|uniref:Uncharacterized protein n=2 Tax=Mycolicibacter TaxID=1073531 RepID=A0A1A2NSW6_MYCSD|nr:MULTISPECIES: hypothetical protein [Mycolicibacter]OBH18173.1 hypothetical protein A5694_01845 [Mycolicibacter sinensis]OBI27807.1 hypothetical protein A5710_04665 [Mycolicibacter sinensis]RRR47679.1 hypothetical protein EHH44_04045 [Mycolicibacter terrae]